MDIISAIIWWWAIAIHYAFPGAPILITMAWFYAIVISLASILDS